MIISNKKWLLLKGRGQEVLQDSFLSYLRAIIIPWMFGACDYDVYPTLS